MPEFHLPRGRVKPEVMVYGISTLPIYPQFADFTFTPRDVRSVYHRIEVGRARFTGACLRKNIHPTGKFIYTNTDGVNFRKTREVTPPPSTETRKGAIMNLELRGCWDPAKIVVKVPRTPTTAQAFRQFRDKFMEEVMKMGQGGYELTAAEICIVSLALTKGAFDIETGVVYEADVHTPFLKLVIGEHTRKHSVAQRCVEPLQRWLDDLKVNPVLSRNNP